MLQSRDVITLKVQPWPESMLSEWPSKTKQKRKKEKKKDKRDVHDVRCNTEMKSYDTSDEFQCQQNDNCLFICMSCMRNYVQTRN